MKPLALRFGFLGCLALAVSCGSDEESVAPPATVPDASKDAPAESASDARSDARDASADTSDAGADTSDASADTGADANDASADTSDAGADTGTADADAGGPDGDADTVPNLVLCPLVAGKVPVAASPDGKKIAYLSCAQTTPAVVVYDLATRASSELGPAPADSSVEWLLDGSHVYYGSAAETHVRAANIMTPAVRISTGVIDGHRAFMERISNTAFAPRLMVLETEGTLHRISVRKADDGYATRLILVEDAALQPDISQVSASGRTLIATLVPARARRSIRRSEPTSLSRPSPCRSVRTTGSWLRAGSVTRTISRCTTIDWFESSSTPASSPSWFRPARVYLAGTAHLLDREDAPGKKHVYFIQNGDPSRRVREGDEPIEVLATANAVAQVMSPDLSTMLYLSDQQLSAVSAEGGGTPRPLTTEANAETALNVVFSTTTRDAAYIANRKLFRISLANDAVQAFSVIIDPASVKFDGLGQSILFVTDTGALQRVSPGSATPETIAPSVQGYWPMPTTSTVLVAINGRLETRVLTP